MSNNFIPMKKSGWILATLLLFSACKTDYEKYLSSVKECEKERAKNINSQHIGLDEAIASYDWTAAHAFLNCYPDGMFEGNGDATPYQMNADIIPAQQAIYKLYKSESEFWIKQGEFDKAINVAKELLNNYDFSEEAFRILESAVLYYLEKGDKETAKKWAKRAPSNLNPKCKDTKKISESQQGFLQEKIKQY